MTCERCGRELTSDDVGLTRKLIDRQAKEFLCISCLAERFHASEERLAEMAESFRRMGCSLFQ